MSSFFANDTDYANIDCPGRIMLRYDDSRVEVRRDFSLRSFADEQHHLSTAQQNELFQSLKEFDVTFEGRLGKYRKLKIHLERKPGTQPKHMRPYPVAMAHHELFKQEAQRRWDYGVIEPCGSTEHGYPTFIVHKKNGGVR